jgi:hypothetical protein
MFLFLLNEIPESFPSHEMFVEYWQTERRKLRKQLAELELKISKIDSLIWEFDEREKFNLILYKRSNYNKSGVDYLFARAKILESDLFGKSSDVEESKIEHREKFIVFNIKIGPFKEFQQYSEDEKMKIAYKLTKDKIMNVRRAGVPVPFGLIDSDKDKLGKKRPNIQKP